MNNYKVFICEKNTPWGIIKHPLKGNIYKNIINFVDKNGNFDAKLKDEFINEKLFKQMPPKGWKNEVDNAPVLPIKTVDELTFTFKTTIKNQKERLSFDELKNSDFAIIKNIDGSYAFYALIVENIDRNIISFKADLDIFFTYNLDKNLFQINAKNYILRAHSDRFFNENGTEKINWDDAIKSPFFEFEPFAKNYHNISWKNNPLETKWLVFYFTRNANLGFSSTVYEKLNKYEKKNAPLAYYSVFLPLKKIKTFLGSPKSSLKKWMTFVNLRGDNFLGLHFLTKPPEPKIDLIFTVENGEIKVKNASQMSVAEYAISNSVFINEIEATKIRAEKINTEHLKVESNLISLQKYPKINEIYKPKIYDNFRLREKMELREIGLFHPQFYNISIKKWHSEAKKYYLPFLENGDSFGIQNKKIESYYFFTPERNQNAYWLKSGGIGTWDNFLEGNYLITDDPELPTSQDHLAEFYRNNKNAFEANKKWHVINTIISGILGIAGNVVDTAKNIATGGGGGGDVASAIFGAAGATGTIIKNLVEFGEHRDAKIADLANQLPSIVKGNAWYFNWLSFDKIEIFLIENWLTERHQQIVFDDYYKKGYRIEKIAKLGDYLNSRYIFNFIQAENAFNVFEKKLSPKIKQIISETLQDGVYIWHYRKRKNWNGIMNFDFENTEISLMN